MALRLNTLQQCLQSIYEVDVLHSVDDFLITDRKLAHRLDSSARDIEEKLLVRQDGEDLDLALYLDADLLARLTANDPTALLHDDNLADFCTALEGVSHFLYLIWNAAQGRRINCLELEMQAEVDKYIALLTLISRQRKGYVPAELHPWLFAEPVFDSELTDVELEHYRDANHYAGKYCFHLESRYLRLRDRCGVSLLNELRHFYRLTLHDKIRRIECLR